ncbi:MAG: hypothetical protein Q8N54_13545 [Sulfurimicrobium sp.]|jgi:hypothetical protein|nr:hypothetical protein [Sulfurimicrobium sp.]MDZ7657640.1 hypothetical protein [Sulfurimicrobium sp.]
MSSAQLKQVARESGIKKYAPRTPYSPQTELIRKTQSLRGNEPCFASDKSDDCAEICPWRRECRKLKAAWLR